jgi:hypothetical protein
VSHTIIRIEPYGRLGNLMGQLMFADHVKRRCLQRVAIEGYNIPEWCLKEPLSDAPSSDIVVGSYLTRSSLLCAMIDAYRPALVNLVTPIFRVGSYGKPEDYFHLFRESEPIVSIPDDCLVIHVRAGDVSTLTNDKYGPLPIRYYQYLLAQTALRPLFICEPGRTPYLELLKATFPKADTIGGTSAIDDFQIIRSAKNVALSVSSFSWMATFLSSRVQQIHLPLAGHFDPADDLTPDFLPLNDTRYIFHHVSREAWSKRYEDPVGPRDGFSIASRSSVRALKTMAFLRTAKSSAKIHGGLLKRMAAHA